MERRATARQHRLDELDVDRVDRVVAAYLVLAGLWIVVSGPATAMVAGSAATQAGLEIAKGLAFVVVTAFALRVALHRWAQRLRAAARQEHEAAERLRQAEELRSAFLNGVSHELRTPLTSIIGYGDTVLELCRRNGETEVEVLARRLVVNAHRLQGLVLDLLDTDALLRGMGTTRLRSANVGELVHRMADGLDVGGRDLVLEGETVDAEVDVAKFERIVDILLDNAVRHTPRTATIQVRWARQGDDLVLTVEDDGPGLPTDVADRLFQPFVQGPSAAEGPNPGMGIGLTLADQYARLHRGHVTAANRAEGGARFEVHVPLAHAMA